MYLFFQVRNPSSSLPAKIRLYTLFVDAAMSDDKDAVPRNLSPPHDEEKVWVPALDGSSPEPVLVDDAVKPQARVFSLFERVTFFLTRYGIETNGIDPIPPNSRTDSRLFQMFFVWFSSSLNVLGLGTGASGPAFFGLSTKQCLVIMLFVDIVSCAVPAYFAVFGPKLGMRSMVQARYSWGYWPAKLPAALNVFSMQGFLILNCIIGGQTLASVSSHLDDTLGIVIIGLISLALAFCGYRVIHIWESAAWIPNAITFIIMLGVGGKHLSNAPPTAPVTATSVVTFITTIAASVISWCMMTPDYGVYHNHETPSLRIFIYTYLGFFLSSLISHFLGAVFAASAAGVPGWAAGFDNGNSVGGLIAAVLAPLGGFGRFLTVLLALSVPSACAPTMYTFASSCMAVEAVFARIPRWVYAVVSEGILIPVAIIGAKHFYNTFVDVLNIIGYWSCLFASIILAEHFVFRRGRWEAYDLATWDSPSRLPPGIAALLAFLCAFGVVIPCMSQAWYTGPIARAGTGDLGIIVGSAVAFILYVGLRTAEKAAFGR
ncbi:cytosine-purine permease [Phanerochaete sordida]|uniref:Cytosine-purine permease n=1 Tax=Phanerochaete sordida TaxID=48140 RepID=A0A9P3G2C9_9APHY|nr:cytosine-purine permease [Phanerochaete sordida]